GANGKASINPSISRDGRYVVFETTAALVGDDTNGGSGGKDIYLRDRQLNTTERVSLADGDAQVSFSANFLHGVVSDDGRYVAFMADDTNVIVSGLNDNNGYRDILRYDRTNNVLEAVSNVGPATGGSFQPSISADGRYVAFY